MKNKRIAPTEFHKLLQLDLDTFEHVISKMSSPLELIRLLNSLNHRMHNYHDYNRLIRKRLRHFNINTQTEIINFVNSLINGGSNPTEIIDFLNILNFDPNISEHGETILHRAVRENNTRLVQVLIQAGSNVNAQTTGNNDDERSETPLYIASYMHNENIVRLLLEAGADVNIRTSWGFTPLIQASAQLQLGIVKLLLDAKADPNIRTEMNNDYADQNVLDVTVQAERSHRVVRLLLNYVDVNSSNTHGDTALHFYLSYGNDPKVLIDLIHAGADVNKQNNDGETPLQICVENQLEDEMMELLRSGANPNVTNNNGQTVFDILRGINNDMYFKLVNAVNQQSSDSLLGDYPVDRYPVDRYPVDRYPETNEGGPSEGGYDQDRYYTDTNQWFSFGKKKTRSSNKMKYLNSEMKNLNSEMKYLNSEMKYLKKLIK